MNKMFFVCCSLLLTITYVSSQMILMSPSFEKFEKIPLKFGCDVQERDPFRPNPPLFWKRAPVKAQSFILIMDDITENEKVHWIAIDIPKETSIIDEDSSETSMPYGTKELANAFGVEGYSGPCPYNTTHEYRFRLFAMPTAQTKVVSKPIASDIVKQIEQDALYVSVLMSSFSLGAPKNLSKEIIHNATIPYAPESIVSIRQKEVEGCSWIIFSYDMDRLQIISIGSIIARNKPYTEFRFNTIMRGVADVRLSANCLAPLSEPVFSNFRIYVTYGTNATNITLYGDTDIELPDSSFRFIKPSEVLKPQRKHVNMNNNDLKPDCSSNNGVDECVTNFEQALVEENQQNKKKDETKLCDIEKRYSHSGRFKNGEVCSLRVRMRDVNCDNFQFPTNSSCFGSNYNSSNPNNLEYSPSIYWENVPSGVESFVLLIEDRGKISSQTKNGRILWVVSDISSNFQNIDFGASRGNKMPPLSIEYPNSQGKTGYSSPCTESDSEPQMIAIHLYAMKHSRTLFHSPLNKPLDSSFIISQLSNDLICSAVLEIPLNFQQSKL
eukprot:c17946_g1_i1.p1 GENE.c17946_g1_i1~~c17946_g1_i1.p1  ORF type:complete len:553 (-),score=202.09 c17946_g1_i1:36-1694(-)